jgi:hypothetical protein
VTPRRLSLADDRPDVLDDVEFARQVELHAELVAARLNVAYWRRRIREAAPRIRDLERRLAESSPPRSRPDA